MTTPPAPEPFDDAQPPPPPSAPLPPPSPAPKAEVTVPVKRLIQALVVLVVAVGVGWFGWNQYSDHKSAEKLRELQKWTASSMQETLDEKLSDPEYAGYGVTVDDVLLIKDSDTRYSGFATVTTSRGNEHKVEVTVKTDGDNYMWTTEEGAFMFIAQEKFKDIFGSP